MIVTRNDRQTSGDVLMGDEIPIDTVFGGTIHGNGYEVLYRTKSGIVSLCDAEDAWIFRKGRHGPLVIDYRPLDVELVVHGPSAEEGRL